MTSDSYSIEVPRTLPDILHLEPGEGAYRFGSRLHRPPEAETLVHLGYVVADGVVTEVDGVLQVWVSLDVSNGNPEMLDGRVYVWLDDTFEEACQRIATHRTNESYSTLTGPHRCILLKASNAKDH